MQYYETSFNTITQRRKIKNRKHFHNKGKHNLLSLYISFNIITCPVTLKSSHNKQQKYAPSFPKTLATSLIRTQINARSGTYHASCHSHPIKWLEFKLLTSMSRAFKVWVFSKNLPRIINLHFGQLRRSSARYLRDTKVVKFMLQLFELL